MKRLTLLLLFALPVLCLAQPGNPSNPAPFGITEALVAGGIVLGVARRMKSKK